MWAPTSTLAPTPTPTTPPTAAPTSTPVPTSPPVPSWQVVPSNGPGSYRNTLHGVAVVSTNDVWAVGYYTMGSATAPWTLAEHWNGSTWSVIPTPTANEGQLEQVAAVSSSDVWAVGSYALPQFGTSYTLAEHWDGSQWKVIPSPNLNASFHTQLNDVAVVASDNVWAVGSSFFGNAQDGQLIEHWNGSQWSVVPTPALGSGVSSVLQGIAALSATDIWVVGRSSGSCSALTEHWDGVSWSVAPCTATGGYGELMAVAGNGPNDVWAVGEDFDPSAILPHSLVEHWDGTRWSAQPSPNPGVQDSDLVSLAIEPDGAIVVLGVTSSGGNLDGGDGFIARWQGGSWSGQRTPAQPQRWRLLRLAARGAAIWAVGSVDIANGTIPPDERAALIGRYA